MTDHVKIRGVTPRIQYVADGILTTYEFPFAVFSTDDIEVYLNDIKQPNTNYSVLGVRDSDGGSVTFVSTPTSGTIITIVRNLFIERTSDFQEGGALRADTLNDEFDYQIACQQQIADNLNRSMVLPPYAIAGDVDLTLPTPSAGKAIVWNSDGTNLENSTVEVNALESTLKIYKESAESAASTATTKAGIASDKADIATTQAGIATTKATEVSQALSTKADKDMDNISNIGKTTIISWIMPDWSTAVSVSTSDLVSSDGYAATKEGFIIGTLKKDSEQNVSKYITVNGVVASALPYEYSGSETFFFIPVSAGDVIKANCSTGNLNNTQFIETKGV